MWIKGLFVSMFYEVIYCNFDVIWILIFFFVFLNIDVIIELFGIIEKISFKEVMLKNFVLIWEINEGVGRVEELV